MNITYIIGLVMAILVFLLGCVLGITIGPKADAAREAAIAAGEEFHAITFTPGNLWNFFDAASIFITIGCTIFIVVASFPGSSRPNTMFSVAVNTSTSL